MGFLSSLLGRRRDTCRRSSCHKGSCTRTPRSLRPLRLVMEPLEERQLLSVSPLGDEWPVNSFTSGAQELADTGKAIAAMPDGGYIVSWASTDQDGDAKGVYAQRFDASGDLLGSESRVNTVTAGNQQRSSVAAAADGSAVVVWQSSGQDGTGTGVFGQRFDADGQPVAVEFQVNVTTDSDQDTPSVTRLTDGGFVVVWAGKGVGDISGVFGRRYNASGMAQGGVMDQRDNTTDKTDGESSQNGGRSSE